MDIFYPSQETDETAVSVKKIDGSSALVVLFVHSGYWQVGSRKIYSFVSKSWTKAGCVVAVVGYNLAPEASLNQMVSEIKSAVKYINTRFPKSKLFLCGHSAGGTFVCYDDGVRLEQRSFNSTSHSWYVLVIRSF